MDTKNLIELKSTAFDLQRVINHYTITLNSVLKQIEALEAGVSKAEPARDKEKTI